MFFPRGPITYMKIIALTNNWTNLQCGKQLPGPNSVPSNNKSCKYKKKNGTDIFSGFYFYAT